MSSKRKPYIYKIPFTLSTNLLALKKDVLGSEKNEVSKLVNGVIDCTSGVEQIQLLQKLQEPVIALQNEKTLSILMDILCEMYFQIPFKAPLKKSFLKLLEVMKQKNKELFFTSMTNAFSCLLCSISGSNELIPAEICYCLDATSFGAEVLKENISSTCTYLSQCLKSSLDSIRSECSPQQSTESQRFCQMILRAINSVLQNFQLNFKLSSDNENYIRGILSCCVELLQGDHILPNCRLNSAMVFTGILMLNGLKSVTSDGLNNSLMQLPELNRFPVISQICFLCGFMATTPFTVSENQEKIVSFHQDVLEKLISISAMNNDSDTSLHCARGILQWMLTTKDMTASDKLHDALGILFCDNSPVLHSIVDYVLSNIDHFNDSLCFVAREIFRNFMILYSFFHPTDTKNSTFLKCFLHQCLEMPWHFLGKYPILCVAVDFLGVSSLIHLRPSLPDDLLLALSETGVSSHVFELYQTLYRQSCKEMTAMDCGKLWLKPLIGLLQCGTQLQQTSVQNILPKLLKADSSPAKFLIFEYLESSSLYPNRYFGVLITLLRFTDMEISFDCDDSSDAPCFPLRHFQKSLIHADNQVRLSAFSAICEVKKSTKPIRYVELELIRNALPWNMCCQCPAFRQHLVSLMKKFLLRLKENCLMLKKVSGRDDESSVLKKYISFLKWFQSEMVFNLHPGANFPRRVTALSLLHLLHSIYRNFGIFSDNPLFGDMEYTSLQTLFESLKDTYENNKSLLLDLLRNLPSNVLFCEGRSISAIFNVAIKLLSSPRPPDSVTTSYILVYLSNLDFSNEDLNQIMQDLKEEGYRVCWSFLELEKCVHQRSSFIVIQILMSVLSHQLHIAEKSLIEAAATGPMYGVLICIRYIVRQISFSSITDETSLVLWQMVLSTLLSVCFEVAAVVEPIVCNLSPEGHLPIDTDESSITQIHVSLKNSIFSSSVSLLDNTEELFTNDVKAYAVTSQMLLICSWRAHKEVSLLFGAIAEGVMVNKPEPESSLILSFGQLKKIGQYFIQQLSQVKHRGAFEQAYVGFHQLCQKMWRWKDLTLSSLPKKWLKDFFSRISGEFDLITLCSTRRSAGLPFLMQALLVSEPEVNRSSTFKTAIAFLLDMAMNQSMHWVTDTQVHALNVIRTLYRDSSLGETVMPYVSEGLKAAITGFKSPFWAVRNASTLLFSALVTRIFGVNRSKDEVTRKNCLTGRVFFVRFPEMFEFLLDELKLAVKQMQSETAEKSPAESSLYPLLLVLGRLYPSVTDGHDSNMKLSSFVPYIIQCAHSCTWKIRIASAKALIPLLSLDDFHMVLQNLFSALPTPSQQFQHNHLHGTLLQIRNMVKEMMKKSKVKEKNDPLLCMALKERLETWIISKIHIATNWNASYSSRVLYIEIVCRLLPIFVVSIYERIVNEALTEISMKSMYIGKEEYLINSVVFLLTYMLHASELTARHCGKNEDDSKKIILYMLNSSHYEVRSATLSFLINLLNEDKQESILMRHYSELSIGHENLTLLAPWKHTSETKKSIMKAAVSSLTDFLLDLCCLEKNPECLSKMYVLLYIMQKEKRNTSEYLINDFDVISMKIQNMLHILNRIQKCEREDIENAAVLYRGELVLNMLETILKCDQNFQNSDLSRVEAAVKIFCTEIEQSANPDCTIERRQTALHILDFMKSIFLSKIYEILDLKLTGLWRALMLLLTDDEPDIKSGASEIVAFLKQHELQGQSDCHCETSTVPVLALEEFIGIFVDCFKNLATSYCLSVLLQWMLSSTFEEELDAMDDEKPFDKGEMNVYAEDFTLLHLTAKKLKIVLSSCCNLNSLLIQNDPSKNETNSKPVTNVTEFLTIEEVALDCAQNVSNLLGSLDYHPFSNRQFERHLLKISQYTYVLSCLYPFMNICVKNDIDRKRQAIINVFDSLPCKNSFLKHLQNVLTFTEDT